jgi:hypothetical protein
MVMHRALDTFLSGAREISAQNPTLEIDGRIKLKEF